MFIKAKCPAWFGFICCNALGLKSFSLHNSPSPWSGQQGHVLGYVFLRVSWGFYVSDSFLCLRRPLCSFLFISKLEAEVVCLPCMTIQAGAEKTAIPPRLKGDSALPSGAKCHYVNRPQIALIYRYLYAVSCSTAVWIYECLLQEGGRKVSSGMKTTVKSEWGSVVSI